MSDLLSAVPAGGLTPDIPLVLDATDIRVAFPRPGRTPVRVIDGLGLGLERGQVTVLLGESGSGKTVFARAITGLAAHSATVTGSSVFDGTDLVAASASQLRDIHGDRIGMVPQDPNASLDPMRRIGAQICETLLQHRQVPDRTVARRRAIELLAQVQIREPERVVRCYPHEVSGGMRQRIAIAIAISCNPELIVADEPSSALDASVGAHVVGLLDDLRRRLRTAILFITHDIGIAALVASQPQDRVAVMLAGQIVELGFAPAVLRTPRHGYTRALLAAEPSAAVARGHLALVPDDVRARRDWGPLREVAPGHAVADGEAAS
ncbi:ABC transporter ATP-binding protein [Microbacterium sp. SORGH_AS_0888]|uniref:ABC transporter ATP-binding protein n=1 Tax=Microbacterium sp. SORGH_AS_0888 TaxID=3041791 RepID=UPI002788F9CE|nr:ABC transporter ATP-binding protein [Microbacterium sp. SORGH_AS_0888]MDQ1129914.1 ABC-type dipeptide/oligopeptide/nickel transport system ATPase component [Microbacterium sp. SORGH_AS_0888]